MMAAESVVFTKAPSGAISFPEDCVREVDSLNWKI